MAEQAPLFEQEPTFSVAELSAGIGAVLTRAFPDEVWVQGEIANLQRPGSGHVYFDLVGDGCRLRVTLWESDKRVVNAVLRRAGGAVRMSDGTQVRIRARVQWWPEGGQASLRMLSIDTAYTLGRLAEARELLVQRLQAEGLLALQPRLVLAPVPLRVGLITSEGSAAAGDFLHTLEASGHAWQVALADARVQGVEAEASVVAALHALTELLPAVDVICVVRGGGARTDLAAFDSEAIAVAIARCPIPVLTGIGHEIDTTVADLVAHTRHKTPTACASALVTIVAAWRERLDGSWASISRAATGALDRSGARLERASGRAASASRHHLQAQEAALGSCARRLAAQPSRLLDAAARTLDGTEAQVRALDPMRLLARGWSITRDDDGRLVRSVTDAAPGAALVTTVGDGELRSTVDG
jgi:exodeoxyribonuclease VII large subunit